MKTGLVAACGLVAAMLAPIAAHAQDDDWEFAEDAGRHLSVAAVRYDAGMAIIVQCRDGALTTVMTGLPVAAETLELQATRADGRRDTQTWGSGGAAGAFRSETAARDVRFLRGGGSYGLRTVAGATPTLATTFDLPTQSANLDRVLTACGWALTDDRDGLTRASRSVSLTDPEASTPRPRRSTSRDITGQGRPVERPVPRTPAPAPAEQQFSCIIRDTRLADCRPDHPPPVGAELVQRAVALLNGRRVFAPNGAATEGEVIFVHPPQTLIAVSREEIAR